MSSKPRIPGNGSWPAPRRLIRFRLISSFTEAKLCPLARSWLRVLASGAGEVVVAAEDWRCGCTIRHYVQCGVVRIFGGT